MKQKHVIAIFISGMLTIAGSGPAPALEVPNKDQVVKLTKQAIVQAKQGESGGMIATAKEAQRLAYNSLKGRHSFIMQVANDRLQKAIQEGEKGQMEPAIKLLEEVVSDVMAEGKDTMTP
ncbi:MAG: small metal-binding protein SmbP [Gammaproteobacteria bacterium]